MAYYMLQKLSEIEDVEPRARRIVHHINNVRFVSCLWKEL